MDRWGWLLRAQALDWGLSELGILPVISLELGMHFSVSPSMTVPRFYTHPLVSHSFSLSQPQSLFFCPFLFVLFSYSLFIFLCAFLPLSPSLHLSVSASAFLFVFLPLIPVSLCLSSPSPALPLPCLSLSFTVSLAQSSISFTFTLGPTVFSSLSLCLSHIFPFL